MAETASRATGPARGGFCMRACQDYWRAGLMGVASDPCSLDGKWRLRGRRCRVRFLSMRVSACGVVAVGAIVAACTHQQGSPPAPASTTSLALRVVDSSGSGQPLLAVRIRLIGPLPQQDTVACSDSTRQSVLWISRVRPGRYQLVLRRTGFEGRLVLVDVAQHQTDTVTVGLRTVPRDM